MGQDIPKQFIHVNNIPIIVYTLLAFEKHPQVDRIHVACVDGWEKVLEGYVQQFNIKKYSGMTAGGATRYLSTRQAMEALGADDDDVIIVHDSVRPLVTNDSITSTIEVCRKNGNSMSIIPCADTMYEKTTAEKTSLEVNRDKLVRGQTPEAVNGARMREMYQLGDEKNIHLDSISALQIALGFEINFAKGSPRNIKLTTTEDIELFKALLSTTKDEWLK